jgi:hypothetical protein
MFTKQPIPKNSLITRRKFIKGSALASFVVLFGGTAAVEAAKSKKKLPTTKKKAATKDSTKVVTTVATAPATKAGGGGAAGAQFSASQEMQIAWTYTAQGGGGRVHNPYVAVWIEDASDIAIRIVHLEYQQGRGNRWLNDLSRWSRADQTLVALGIKSSAQTFTNATRIPGSYSVVWDGKNADGAYVPNGTYNVYVEAAREKGPYQFVKHTVTINGEAFSQTASPSGDLTNVKLDLRAKA